MIDLTDDIEKALNLHQYWFPGEFQNSVDSIEANNSGWLLDWDEGAGEEWASFIRNREGSAILHVKRPLLFYVKSKIKLSEDLPSFLVKVGCSDMSSPNYSVSKEVLAQLAGRYISSEVFTEPLSPYVRLVVTPCCCKL